MATFLTLPLELRELIYEYIFSTFTIKHGFGITSSANRTALLLTCKQVHHEAWRHLPLNANFEFRGPETMLNTLLDAGQAVITRVRHVRIKSFPFPLYANGRPNYYPTYYCHNALSLLPGLHLDRLVVEDSFHGFGLVDGWRDVVTYFDIEGLLKSDAWRELVYITPNTDFIASGYDHRRKRLAQPETWDALLKERDGETSGAEVEMWITPKSSSSSSSQTGPAKPQSWSALPGHEVIENWRVAGPEQDLKGEVQIIARRGKKANVVQTGVSQNQTWQELKNKEGGFSPKDWTPYYNDMADAVGWVYGGWGRRMELAHVALGQ
ncbi:hypothetical protein DM02DRAFT_23283 [Periconia macrospinosa]|uniref:F-box domain-containing protein n=1 Tax=Periconia macrospinosa TaxID=97972 RepID=A0A2V1DN01_9PLEO|nr:hypothetical protein DM02DRAFT_23283 [Periconia macrospinosa]